MSNLNARQLRVNMTDAERRLWSILRGRQLLGYKFRRQHPIGPFILDLACVEYLLAIEADGGQHAENEYDQRRTDWLENRGWRVMRFWNNEILANSEGVIDTIRSVLTEAKSMNPHPPATRAPPSPASGRGDG